MARVLYDARGCLRLNAPRRSPRATLQGIQRVSGDDLRRSVCPALQTPGSGAPLRRRLSDHVVTGDRSGRRVSGAGPAAVLPVVCDVTCGACLGVWQASRVRIRAVTGAAKLLVGQSVGSERPGCAMDARQPADRDA